MDKKIIVVGAALAALIVVALVAACFYWFGKKALQVPPEQFPVVGNQIPANESPNNSDVVGQILETVQTATTAEESLLENITSSVQTNPVENKPDINPATQTNPIRKIKINPFE